MLPPVTKFQSLFLKDDKGVSGFRRAWGGAKEEVSTDFARIGNTFRGLRTDFKGNIGDAAFYTLTVTHLVPAILFFDTAIGISIALNRHQHRVNFKRSF